MPDINPSLPVVGQPDSTEEPKVVTALSQLIAAVNDVDSAQIHDGSITQNDIAAGAAGLGEGSFSAYRSTDVNLSSSSVVVFDAEERDLSNWYDVTTGKFQPQRAGIYAFTWAVRSKLVQTSDVSWFASLMKNADTNSLRRGQIAFQRGVTPLNSVGSGLLELNGSSDFVQVFFQNSTASAQTIQPGIGETFFQGYLVSRT